MDTYGFISAIGLAGVALLAYHAFMENQAGQTRTKARAVAVTPPRRPARRPRRRRRRR